MWFVLYILTIAVAYCVFVILSILLPIFIQWIHHREVPNEAYQSLKKYSLVLGVLLIHLIQNLNHIKNHS